MKLIKIYKDKGTFNLLAFFVGLAADCLGTAEYTRLSSTETTNVFEPRQHNHDVRYGEEQHHTRLNV